MPARSLVRARRTTTGGRGSGLKPDLAPSRPYQRFGNRIGMAGSGAIMRLNTRARRDPAESGHAEQRPALDHLAARFGHRRRAEFHATRQRTAVPWGARA